ncbi:endospore germination permease [Tissierella carlieri]|uniref:Spore germination protein n=1 Tax=Tissierella carlieri TaxID=689904 RepID=A0ABT1SAY3_9FIRM|nr:endospore germination permease [Tissierella carlieri]MCQ4923497.1 spore germination protein [Tissierella carlieri]
MIEKISTRQIIFVIIISRVATVLTVMPIIHMGSANQDIWVMILVSSFYTILSIIPILFLSAKFSNLTIIGYIEKIFGKVIGKIIGIFYGIFFIRTSILFFYIATQMIRTAFMTELAPIIIILILMIVCIYITSKGLEVIARTAELFGPIIIISLIIFMLLGYNNIDFSVLLPIYRDSGFLDINLGAIQMTLIFTDIYILAMNIPQLQNKKDLYKIIIKATAYSLSLILMMIVVTQTSLGIEQTRHSNYPFLTYVRMVRTYSVFERIESAFLVIWTLSIMIRIITYLYISSYAFKEIFKKKEVNIFVYIITIISAVITYYLADINPMIEEIAGPKLLEYIYYFVFKIGIPTIAIIVYFFRRSSFEKQERLGN